MDDDATQLSDQLEQIWNQTLQPSPTASPARVAPPAVRPPITPPTAAGVTQGPPPAPKTGTYFYQQRGQPPVQSQSAGTWTDTTANPAPNIGDINTWFANQHLPAEVAEKAVKSATIYQGQRGYQKDLQQGMDPAKALTKWAPLLFYNQPQMLPKVNQQPRPTPPRYLRAADGSYQQVLPDGATRQITPPKAAPNVDPLKKAHIADMQRYVAVLQSKLAGAKTQADQNLIQAQLDKATEARDKLISGTAGDRVATPPPPTPSAPSATPAPRLPNAWDPQPAQTNGGRAPWPLRQPPAAVPRPAANVAPVEKPAASPFKSAADVKAAVKSGKLKREDAVKILQDQFGME